MRRVSLRLCCASVFLLSVLSSGCKRGAGASAKTNAPALSQPPIAENGEVLSKPEAVRAAAAWLDALRSRDREKLGQRSSAPFELRELVQYPKCEATRAENRDEVATAAGCLLADDLLVDELKAQPDPVLEAVSQSELPPWAASIKSVGRIGQLVLARLPGNGVSYEFVLLATKAGVSAVWKFAEYDSE